MSSVLIIDDDIQICRFLKHYLGRTIDTVEYTLTLSDGLKQLTQGEIDVVFLDVNLPDGNGLEAVGMIQKLSPAPEIIIMTAEGDPDGAELAMKLNTWDYIQKAGNHKAFQLSLMRALEYRHQKKSRDSDAAPLDRADIIGRSEGISRCLDQVARAARGDMPVLIMGETGTGKELFARAIHQNSNRRKKDFIVVDCAALPAHLVESTLFGHTRGAFTGADSDKSGLLKMAHNGTLFLDELGELPLDIQIRFLRALQEKKFRPVGGRREIHSNFRLVAATNKDLHEMTVNKTFREDLYYRVMSVKIELPALKNRQQDIELITKTFINRKNEVLKKQAYTLSEEFIHELETYHWPGNVRELKNAVDSACANVIQGETLYPKHLPERIRTFNIRQKVSPKRKKNEPRPQDAPVLPLKTYIDRVKKDYLVRLLERTGGNIKEICRVSEVSRGHLYSLFKKYGITPAKDPD